MDDEEQDIDPFLGRTVRRLRDTKGNDSELHSTIELYLTEGSALEVSPSELWDYFDVSSPGLPEEAGFSPDEQKRAVEMFSRQSSERFG